jgi:hypothetical protein
LVPIVVQLGRRFFSRRAQPSGAEDDRSVISVDVGQGDLDEHVIDTSSFNNSDPTCDDILPSPAPEAKVKINDSAFACKNVLALHTSRAESMAPQHHPSRLPGLAAGSSSASDPKNIQVTNAGRLLRLWAAVAFVLSFLPLMLFYLTGRRLELVQEPEQRALTVHGDSGEKGEACEMPLEWPEVRPVEHQVCGY